MRFDLVIFDLDGTVLNTLGDLAAAANAALTQFSYPTHSVEEIRTFIGNGVANLMRRAAPAKIDDARCGELLAAFKAYYALHMNDQTAPYEGIPALLADLRNAKIKVGINSNKFDAALQALCRAHFAGLYDCALGESAETPKKPDPAAALRIMNELGVAPARTLYVGDSAVDLQTAANAGIDGAWVSWGFRRPEELKDISIPHRFDSVAALSQFLLA